MFLTVNNSKDNAIFRLYTIFSIYITGGIQSKCVNIC